MTNREFAYEVAGVFDELSSDQEITYYEPGTDYFEPTRMVTFAESKTRSRPKTMRTQTIDPFYATENGEILTVPTRTRATNPTYMRTAGVGPKSMIINQTATIPAPIARTTCDNHQDNMTLYNVIPAVTMSPSRTRSNRNHTMKTIDILPEISEDGAYSFFDEEMLSDVSVVTKPHAISCYENNTNLVPLDGVTKERQNPNMLTVLCCGKKSSKSGGKNKIGKGKSMRGTTKNALKCHAHGGISGYTKRKCHAHGGISAMESKTYGPMVQTVCPQTARGTYYPAESFLHDEDFSSLASTDSAYMDFNSPTLHDQITFIDDAEYDENDNNVVRDAGFMYDMDDIDDHELENQLIMEREACQLYKNSTRPPTALLGESGEMTAFPDLAPTTRDISAVFNPHNREKKKVRKGLAPKGFGNMISLQTIVNYPRQEQPTDWDNQTYSAYSFVTINMNDLPESVIPSLEGLPPDNGGTGFRGDNADFEGNSGDIGGDDDEDNGDFDFGGDDDEDSGDFGGGDDEDGGERGDSDKQSFYVEESNIPDTQKSGTTLKSGTTQKSGTTDGFFSEVMSRIRNSSSASSSKKSSTASSWKKSGVTKSGSSRGASGGSFGSRGGTSGGSGKSSRGKSSGAGSQGYGSGSGAGSQGYGSGSGAGSQGYGSGSGAGSRAYGSGSGAGSQGAGSRAYGSGSGAGSQGYGAGSGAGSQAYGAGSGAGSQAYGSGSYGTEGTGRPFNSEATSEGHFRGNLTLLTSQKGLTATTKSTPNLSDNGGSGSKKNEEGSVAPSYESYYSYGSYVTKESK